MHIILCYVHVQEKLNVNTKFYESVCVVSGQSSQFSQSESWSLDGWGFSSCTPTDSQLSVSTPSCSFSLLFGASSDTQTKLSDDSDLWCSLLSFVSTTGATGEKNRSH